MAVAMGCAVPASGQQVSECTSAAYKAEADQRGRCTQPDPRVRGQCVERIAAVRERTVTRCLEQHNARIAAQNARAAQRRAAETQRQIDAERRARKPN